MIVVIPVAGLGTRMLPATKAIPKEMLPVVDQPLIQRVVQEAVLAGASDIVLVTHASKNSIENHFDTSFELEATLEKRVKRQLLDDIKSICPPHVRIISVRQGEPKGLGHAIYCAKSIIGDRDFAVMLPDVLLDEHTFNPKTQNLAEMVAIFKKTHQAQIMVEEVPPALVNQYGIAGIHGASVQPGEYALIEQLVEKPSIENAPSNLAVVGRYILPKSIWKYLEMTPPGAGGEIQLTDAISLMMNDGFGVCAYRMHGESHDCGSKSGLLIANVAYGLRHPETADALRAYLQKISLTAE